MSNVRDQLLAINSGLLLPNRLTNVATCLDAMVELFMLVKGIDASLTETWFWVSQGPFAPILTRGFQEAISPPAEG